MTIDSAISLMSSLGAPWYVVLLCKTIYIAYFLYRRFKR